MAKKNNILKFPSLMTSLTLVSLTDEVRALKLLNRKNSERAVKVILKALDLKDHYTFGHSTRVAYFSRIIGIELGLDEEELYELELAALVHDIGKIGVSDAVLLKPARLTEDEFTEMKSHPEMSEEILSGIEEFNKMAKYARHHHERFDGRGYPDGLKGEEIPLFSRIILIGDTFDAMTSSRIYRKALDHKIAFDELLEFSGSQFDGALVKKFIMGMEKEGLKNEEKFSLNLIEGNFDKEAA